MREGHYSAAENSTWKGKGLVLVKKFFLLPSLDKMRNDIEQLSEKLDTFIAQREGSSSKDKGENYG